MTTKRTNPSNEDAQRREQALEASFLRFGAAAKRFEEASGLRLPRHVAVWDAFHRSASPLELEGLRGIGRYPGGIMMLFGDQRVTAKALKEALRWSSDPEEFITVMNGDSDGLHYGLWYEDPAELPSHIAMVYARDDGKHGEAGDTIIGVLAKEVDTMIEYQENYGDGLVPAHLQALSSALKWFRRADKNALADDGLAGRKGQPRKKEAAKKARNGRKVGAKVAAKKVAKAAVA